MTTDDDDDDDCEPLQVGFPNDCDFWGVGVVVGCNQRRVAYTF